jgi:sulfite oxidase
VNAKDAGAPVPLTSRPLNAETPLPGLTSALTPSRSFYVRSHFDIPRIGGEDWTLALEGAVERPTQLGLRDLLALPSRDVWMTLECAGNGRRAMDPVPPGLAWGFGAVGTARFTGVPLALLLDRARVRSDAEEVLFVGADRGAVESGRVVPFARSLPLDVARHPDTLLALAMNGLPLRPEHGYPARLIVPGWYAMASVKWLARIEVLTGRFDGFFQKDDYVYAGEEGSSRSTPVSLMRVRSVIGTPAEGAELPPGSVEIAGTAWSGQPPVVRVEVSVDGGTSWQDAELGSAPSPNAARPWWHRVRLDVGSHSILARATDSAGNVQPTEPIWNARGYGNNVTHRIEVNVTAKEPGDQPHDLKPAGDLRIPDAVVRMNLMAGGEAGRAWLAALPGMVAELRRRWDLSIGPAFEGGCVGFVAPAERGGERVVLKLSPVDDETRTEADALSFWDGDGAVRLLEADPALGALLLERLDPGTSLDQHPDREEAIAIGCALLRRLWRPIPERHPFALVPDMALRWAREIPQRFDRLGRPFEAALAGEAVEFCTEFATRTENLVLANRDYHLGNVLAARREPWLMIDPKPLAGEPSFDTGHLLRSLLPAEFDRSLVRGLVERLAGELDLEAEAIGRWAFVRSVEDALWGLSVGSTDVRRDLECARQLATAC